MLGKLIALSFLLCLSASLNFAQNLKKRVVFFGDSITELGVKENGYITKVGSLIKEKNLSDKFELIGAGVSGNKIYDLYLRLETDVLSKSPDIVVIYIGVNDVWHKRLLGTGTDFDKFGKFYEAITSKMQTAKIKVILCTPAVVGERTDFSNELDGDLNLYSKWIREFAAKNEFPLVDLRKSFLDYNLNNNKDNKASGILTTDKVHLNQKGNELVAQEIWKVLQTF
jgi:lysophospholipase L1-like esterase